MNTLRRIDWRKFGHSLRIQGALSVMVVAISQLWGPEFIFVCVGITILGMIIEGPANERR